MKLLIQNQHILQEALQSADITPKDFCISLEKSINAAISMACIVCPPNVLCDLEREFGISSNHNFDYKN